MSNVWPMKQLRELADIQVSNVDKKFYTREKPVRLCNYLDVYSNEYITSEIQFMEASATPAEIERFGLHCGDVIITKDSETPDDIGIPTVIIEEIDNLVCGYHLAVIRPNQEELDPIFLAKQLSTPRVAKYFAGQAGGSTRFGLPISAIEAVEIPTPSKPEQTQIAAILSTIDRAIEQTEAIIAKQQRIKTGLMQDLLTRGIDEQGNIRSETTHEFKDSPLGRIPVEWEVGLFGNFIRQTGGIIQTGPFGTQVHASEYQAEGVPMVMPQDIDDSGWISDNRLIHISKNKAKELQRHAMRPNDVIFARRGDLSRCAVITEREENWICGTDFMLVRVPESRIMGFWIARIYRSFLCQQQVLAKAVGSTMLGINTGLLSNLVVPIPPANEQKRILNVIQSLATLIQAESDKLANLKVTKTGLMQDLLTGRVRVTGLMGEEAVRR